MRRNGEDDAPPKDPVQENAPKDPVQNAPKDPVQENAPKAPVQGDDVPRRRRPRELSVSPEAMALLVKAGDGRRRIASLARLAGGKVDRVTAMDRLRELQRAGLVEIHARRDRRGDLVPVSWTCSEAGRALVAASSKTGGRRELEAGLAELAAETNPFARRLRAYLLKHGAALGSRQLRALLHLGRGLVRGRLVTERELSLAATGRSKALRLAELGPLLETVFDVEAERLVRRHGQSVLAWGDFSFSVAGSRQNGLWSRPWIALTPGTIQDMERVRTPCTRLRSIENLTAFEEHVLRECPAPPAEREPTLVLYTGGFPGPLECRFIEILAAAGVREIEHWGDLDLGGLRILRHMAERLPLPVRPWRMDPELVHRLPSRVMPPREVDAVEDMSDEDRPFADLALALAWKGRKLEQEAWFLDG